MQAEDTRPLGEDNAGQPVIDPRDRPAKAKRPLLVRLLPLLIVVVALGGFGGIVGYYYFAGSGGGAEGVAPLIKADQRPVRVRPDNPGGMEVPHQDKEIYDRVASRGTPPSPAAERLLPPPEAPLPRPSTATPGASPSVSSPAAASPLPNTAPSTLPATPPRPPGAPAPQQANIPPPPDMTPPPAASVATIPPPVAGSTNLPRAATPTPVPTPAPQTAAVAPAARPAPGGTGGGSRVVLASVQSQPDAQREWERLRRQHPEALGSLSADFVRTDLGERGVFWRIYVGPAESGPDAQARCASLKQRQVSCFVARP